MNLNRRRTLSAALFASLATLLVIAPATADPAPTEQGDDHTLGSQIVVHEGAGAGDPSQERSLSAGSVEGIDVSRYQRDVDWKSYWDNGIRFAYIKASESTNVTNPYFASQYNGSYKQGLIRGAYHFAIPSSSSGASQADYFIAHGGGWSRDGKTLPGALDLEYNPYDKNNQCYSKSQSAMASWIHDFSNRYHGTTGRWPVIYTSTSWWSLCVGTAGDFSADSPLWVARYNSTVGALPFNWRVYSFWQYTSTPLDKNRFNGDLSQLQAIANG
ncbi:lysozyme [Nocardia brasiliensis]|uniref:lysozyme n=1 Tax=Nocardia brasiliensis TaxID=37326 RepID=UPI00245881B5|nr:lysozyme [Nocardia brasiliensis]